MVEGLEETPTQPASKSGRTSKEEGFTGKRIINSAVEMGQEGRSEER